MRKLPCPQRDGVREHLSIAFGLPGQSSYSITEDELDKLISLYNAYDDACGAPSESLKGHDFEEALQHAIRSAYALTYSGRRLSKLRSNILRDVEYCPICGISPPNELDHYLPKSVFQPLAIYVRNLIPICTNCNRKKGNTVSDDPQQRFIHAYLDHLPSNRFMQANVSIENDALLVEYQIYPDAGLPIDLSIRLTHQLQKLNLNERYSREINLYLTSHTTSFHLASQFGGAAGLRSFLDIQSRIEFERFHSNHWRPLLLLALKNHETFCDGDFLQLLPIPQNMHAR